MKIIKDKDQAIAASQSSLVKYRRIVIKYVSR
jgi:hypothetical protein